MNLETSGKQVYLTRTYSVCYQRQLITNGWSLLKPGGILVYSTCSLSRQQNEDVIGWFLSKYTNAQLEEVPLAAQLGTARIRRSRYDVDLSMTVRLDPICSNTSGFFVAKIRKSLLLEQSDLLVKDTKPKRRFWTSLKRARIRSARLTV